MVEWKESTSANAPIDGHIPICQNCGKNVDSQGITDPKKMRFPVRLTIEEFLTDCYRKEVFWLCSRCKFEIPMLNE